MKKGEINKFVLSIRESKTAAEERKIVEQEKAIIRADISNKKLKQERKILNVSKIILIDMLGYDSSFAYFECMKLIGENDYRCKKIGYMGVSSLCTKTPELLIMCTCQLKRDISSDDPNIACLALCTAANLPDPIILATLQPDVINLFNHENNLIRHRAVAVAISIIRVCPESTGDILSNLNESLMESSSSMFRAVVLLFIEVLKGNYGFRKQIGLYVPLVSITMNRLSQHKNSEGFIDNTTMVYYLKFLSYFAEDLTHEVEKNILEVSKSITASMKYSVKYEVSSLLIRMKNTFLNRFGNNILQSFLNSPNSNLKFCGLRLANEIANWDKEKLKVTIDLEVCLADLNKEVRNLALSLSSKLVNSDNVQVMLKSYLNCLMSVDSSLHPMIVEQISDSLSIPAIEPIWHLDTVIRVCVLASTVPEQMLFSCISLINSNPGIQEYATKKLFNALNSGFRHNALPCLAFWSLGEFPQSIDLLDLEKLLENIITEELNLSQILYLLSMCLKVGLKVPEIRKVCIFVLNHYSFHEDFEINQRGSEYLIILTEFADNVFKDILVKK